jgi:hypothetical protein
MVASGDADADGVKERKGNHAERGQGKARQNGYEGTT